MKKLVLCIIFLHSISTLAQVATGLFQDNYTGSTGMLINPAEPMVDPNQWEVNIVSAGLFFDNNYIYYNQQSAISLINYFQSNYHNGENVYFFNQSTVHLNVAGFAQGPSAYFHIKDYSIGIFTDIRAGASIESSTSPQNLNNLFTVPYNQIIRIPELHGAYMNWAELGVNAAKLVSDKDDNKLYFGGAIKFLGGLTAAKYANNQSFAFERHNDSTVTYTPANMTYAYAQSATGTSPITNFLSFNGIGVGADIGALYILGDQVSCHQLYKWKLGVSINDIGVITFNRRTNDFQLTSAGKTNFPDSAFVHTTTITDLNQTLSDIVYSDTISSHSGSGFSIWLPMSITLLADKGLGNGFYIEASVLRRLAISYNMIYAPNIEAITPRYETRWLTVAIPLSLYNETDFHFGASIRVGPFTIGSDDLESLFVPGKMAGTDVYVGLRFSAFKSNCDKNEDVKKSDKIQNCPPEQKE